MDDQLDIATGNTLAHSKVIVVTWLASGKKLRSSIKRDAEHKAAVNQSLKQRIQKGGREVDI